jgi:UDP-N-acetylmuramoyl-tripeptide--D-alanyl-D-alanine ligase
MTTLDPQTISAATGGTWLVPMSGVARGASIDTRTLAPADIFFALRGEQVDGHAYLEAAAQAGASACIIDRADVPLPLTPIGILLVDDVRRALAKLAAHVRSSFTRTRVVCVTGSVGKTTTVRLIEAALSTSLRVSASQKSFNNDLGVPLTIINTPPDADVLICEIGANAPGEIDALSAIARPDICVITGVGRAHLAGFGSIEGVAREKASMARHIRPGGCVIACADSPALLDALPRGLPTRTFGHAPDADIRIESVALDGATLTVTLADQTRLTVPMPGRHNAMNAAAALGVARALGLEDGASIAGLAHARPAAGRLHVEHLPADPPVRLIDDAYNANPESMLGALATLCDLGADAARRIAIIGDMRELGDHAQSAHAEIAARLDELPIDLVALVGPLSVAASASRPSAILVEEPTDEALADLSALVRPGDAVLVKASRSLRLDRVCDAIRARFAMQDACRADNRDGDARLAQ